MNYHKAKIIKTCRSIIQCRGIVNYRVRQVYIESLFRYYITPFVVTGFIEPKDALTTWNRIQMQVYGL